jgi:HAD superfamily hydrolase (TIGR01458 family)
MTRPDVQLVCLDVDGTLTDGVGGEPLPGAVKAVARLRKAVQVRLVTNSTSWSHGELAGVLQRQGLLKGPRELITPACTARRVLEARDHASGLLLLEEAARQDFTWFREDPSGPTVLLGTEGHSLRVADLQPAFRALLEGAHLYALQTNRFYRKEGELLTDLGPVAAFLEHASGRRAENLGKPSPLVFQALARELGRNLGEMAMVGDDAEFDAAGAVVLGMAGVLVRTGKYRPHDETTVDPCPTAVLDSVADLPDWMEGG